MSNDNPAPNYVNSYQPPSDQDTVQSSTQPMAQPGVAAQPMAAPISSYQPPVEPVAEFQSQAPAEATPAMEMEMEEEVRDEFAPEVSAVDEVSAENAAPAASMSEPNPQAQPLEAENIFFLLGVEDGKEADKEAFLDELQQVIWEDFIENDLELLLTSSEMDQFKQIKGDGEVNDPQVQEALLKFLEGLIPDLEEIMLEKALELKEDLVRERIQGMKEYYSGNETALQQIQQAEDLIGQDKWHDAATTLNTVT